MDHSADKPCSVGCRVAIGLGWLFVAGVVFSLAFFPLRSSTDEWWHLKTGKFIVESGYRLPETDVFTYTAADYPWENHEWLSQVAMYLLYRWGEPRGLGGWRSVILAKSFLLVATYLLLGLFLWRRVGGGFAGFCVAFFWTLVAASVGRRMMWPRPPVVGFAFVVFFLMTLWSHRNGLLKTRWLLVLPFLMPLWANLHGSFILGGVVVAAYFGGEALELGLLWLRRRGEPLATWGREKGRVVLVYGCLGMLCGLASLLTPYGYRLYLLTGRVMSSPELVGTLSELQPPLLRFTWGYVFLFVFLGGGFVFLIVRALMGRAGAWPPVAEVLLVLFFFWQSIHHVRHLPLFGFVGVPLAVWFTREAWRGQPHFRSRALLAGGLVCGLWLVLLPGEALGVWHWLDSREGRPGVSNLERNIRLVRGMEEQPGAYPRRPMGFVRATRPPGRMYNRNSVSGFLIWALGPDSLAESRRPPGFYDPAYYLLFTDNRFDIFGDDFLRDELSVANAHPGGVLWPYDAPVRPWMEVVEDWDINWLFVHRNERVHRMLVQESEAGRDPGWTLVHFDGAFAIWVRDLPRNADYLRRHGIPIPRKDSP